MTIEDIVKAEAENDNTVILFREGIFWKAYEKSAYAFCKHIKPFMVKKKFIKSINDEIVSIGFPMSSAPIILKGKTILLEEERKMVIAIDPVGNEEFMVWKKEQAVTPVPEPLPRASGGVNYSRHHVVSNPNTQPTPNYNNQAMSNFNNQEKEIITRIKLFSLESKTPLECMLFLSEIKRQLS